jgi:hypothetical protein
MMSGMKLPVLMRESSGQFQREALLSVLASGNSRQGQNPHPSIAKTLHRIVAREGRPQGAGSGEIDKEIHALCEALIASEGRLGP